MSDYQKEIFKFDKMLDEYYDKLNKNYETSLGNPNLKFKEGKAKYYNDFFKDIDMALVIRMYIDGLQWLLDYYYNDITYNKWFYMYDKSPLLQDILLYLKTVDDDKIFENSKKALETCCNLSLTEELTPLEQLIYITPFDKEGKKMDLFNGFSDETVKIINEIIGYYMESPDYTNLYPDIKKISKDILTSKTNSEIDCRSAIFMNKCILNVVNDSNLIDESSFRTEFRKKLSVDKQKLIFSENLTGGGMNDLFQEYKKFKNLFRKTGELGYKKEYKRLKYFLMDYI